MKPKAPYVRKVVLGDRSLTAHVYGQRAEEDSLYQVPVAGIALGDHAAIAEDPVAVSSLAELPEGATLEPMIARGEHADQQKPEADAVLVASASQYTPVCCPKHGQSVADALRAVDLGLHAVDRFVGLNIERVALAGQRVDSASDRGRECLADQIHATEDRSDQWQPQRGAEDPAEP
jgi:hypothetical protein